MKYIYATIGIFFWIFMSQLHAATPTVITGEQACKMKSGARGTLNSIQHIPGATTKAVVSGESKVNTDKTIWKGDFLKSGTSVYYIQITATGWYFTGMDANNMKKWWFSQKISNISLYKYNCIRKTNTLISKENLKKASDIDSIDISWVKGGHINIYTTFSDFEYILSESTGRILDFSQYKWYKKEWDLYYYDYLSYGNIKLTNEIYYDTNLIHKKIYTINIPKKEIRYIKTEEESWVSTQD